MYIGVNLTDVTCVLVHVSAATATAGDEAPSKGVGVRRVVPVNVGA